MQKLLKKFGSSELVRAAPEDELAKLVGKAAARKVRDFYATQAPVSVPESGIDTHES